MVGVRRTGRCWREEAMADWRTGRCWHGMTESYGGNGGWVVSVLLCRKGVGLLCAEMSRIALCWDESDCSVLRWVGLLCRFVSKLRRNATRSKDGLLDELMSNSCRNRVGLQTNWWRNAHGVRGSNNGQNTWRFYGFLREKGTEVDGNWDTTLAIQIAAEILVIQLDYDCKPGSKLSDLNDSSRE